MGLFSKASHATGRGRDRTTVIDFAASRCAEVDELRANLSRLFVEEDSEGHDPSATEEIYGTALNAAGSQHSAQSEEKVEETPATSFSGCRSDDVVAKPHTQSLKSSAKEIRSPETSLPEDLTPISVVSPADTKYPDSDQSLSAKTDLAKWSARSLGKGPGNARPFQGFSGNAASRTTANRRHGIVARTKSISRLSRAHELEEVMLNSKTVPDEGKDTAPKGSHSLSQFKSSPPAESVEISERKQHVIDFTASPTTPHEDHGPPARKFISPEGIPRYALVDDLSPSKGKLETIEFSGKEFLESRNDGHSGQLVSLRHGASRDQTGDTQVDSVADEDSEPREGKDLEQITVEENNIISTFQGSVQVAGEREETNVMRTWDIDLDDYAEVFDFDVATAAEFTSALDRRDRLHTSPASPQEEPPFDASSNGSCSSIRMASGEQLQTADGDPAVYEEYSPLSPPSSQVKPKPRKRPPPLLAPEPPSTTSGPSSSPNTGVFGSNGDFRTGGFRITSEGMVGKPPRATRRDSDDAPSVGRVPATVGALTVVRSLAEFRKGPTLGMGAAGKVYLAIHEPSGKSMAIKVVNVYDEAKRNQLLKELDTLSSHVSRFLVRFYGAFYDSRGAVHIALEFMDGGCLHSAIQNFGAIPESVTRMIAVDCLRALRFLHRHNVLHRDFKTANILLSRKNMCAKVSDFGLARDMDAGVSRVDTFVGTVAYMSPERLHGSKYTYASDIWALGISIAECLLGRYPFERHQSFFDYLDTTRSTQDMLTGEAVSSEVTDFVQICTKTDPALRPTAAELMVHPWVKDRPRDSRLFRKWMDDLAAAKSKTAATMRSLQSVRSFLEATG